MEKTNPNKGSQKRHRKNKKILSLEEQTPNIPYVFFKNLYINSSRILGQGLIYYASQKEELDTQCPHCQSNHIYRHAYYKTKPSIKAKGEAMKQLIVKRIRYKCLECTRTFGQKIAGLPPWSRRNKWLNEQISQDFKDSLSIKIISRKYKFSESAIMRAIHKEYHAIKKEKLNYNAPTILGIDEHSIHRGRKYAISIVELKNHRVYDIIEGKSLDKVESRILQYRGGMNIKVLFMDLRPTMRNIAQRLFPRAKVVADRFHVINRIIKSF